MDTGLLPTMRTRNSGVDGRIIRLPTPILEMIQWLRQQEDIFLVGPRNAHAMEVQARELMERQSDRLGDYPDVPAKVR